MATKEIPRGQWERFARKFSRLHDGSIFSMETLNQNLGAQRDLSRRSFRGMVWEPREEMLMIHAGDRRGDHLSHPIAAPARMWLEQTDQGADRTLAIESDNGTTTLVRFRDTPLPEMLDPAVE